MSVTHWIATEDNCLWLPILLPNLCSSLCMYTWPNTWPTGVAHAPPITEIHVSVLGSFHYQKISVWHLNAQFLCTDNAKHGLTHKLPHRMCLLTVTC